MEAKKIKPKKVKDYVNYNYAIPVILFNKLTMRNALENTEARIKGLPGISFKSMLDRAVTNEIKSWEPVMSKKK